MIKDDLVKEAIDVELLLGEMLENVEIVKPFEFNEEQRKILCHTLKFYSKYLKDSINSIQEALGVNDIGFELTQKHILLADEKSQTMCKQDNNVNNEGIS